MELIVRIIPEDEKKHFPAECGQCGWIGSSADTGGGGPIGQSGDYFDIYCPCCGSIDIGEVDNDQPITGWIERLKKATGLVKLLTNKMEGYDISKYNYTHLEEENKAMAKELYELKNKQ